MNHAIDIQQKSERRNGGQNDANIARRLCIFLQQVVIDNGIESYIILTATGNAMVFFHSIECFDLRRAYLEKRRETN